MKNKVRVASFGLNERQLRGMTQNQMADVVISKIDSVKDYHPDLIVFPEAFLKTGGDINNSEWENITTNLLERLKNCARMLRSYVVAPLYEKVRAYPEFKYNTTYLIDRTGEIIGKYRKVHTVETETSLNKVLPGNEIPVFDTDFGRIGIQTCFDIGWREGWRQLAEAGAKLVIWTAAYDGGNLLNTYAAYHMYYVVSSVRTDHAQIIDSTGRTIAEGSRWNGLAIADIDLETTLFHIDNQYMKIDDIRRKLGEKVTIRSYSEENVFTIESNDDEWPIDRIKREFGLLSYIEYHQRATEVQDAWRTQFSDL